MSIGIDLGTTFSCVGHYENGVVKILENENGCRTTPSVLAIDEDGEWLIGQHAKDFVTNPDNCVFDVKRIIGRRFNDVLLQKDMLLWPFRIEKDGVDPVLVLRSGSKTHKFSPVSISAHILRKLKENAERKLGIPVKEAVITVPAYFNASQRRATQEAGSLAGLNVLRILNEPTAAAIAYSLHGGQRLSKRNILIYDLGGGTFDVAVVSIDGPRITVKAKGGDTHLGGEDIDNRLIRALADRFQAEHGIDLMKSFRAMKRLRKAAENAKITLSSSNNARIELDCIHESLDLRLKINRVEFEQLIESILLDTMVHVERAIREAHMRKGQIDEIVLVGGSTRIPRLKEILREAFPSGTKICETIHPDEAVAYGAAVISAVLTGVEEVQDMRMNDMIPLSIGIECKRNYMSVMIKRGTYFPCKHTMVYQNTHDFQTVIDISIYEGERALCAANNHLGNISMSIEPRRRGETIIEVTLEVDHNGILQVTAVDVNTKAAISAPILYDHCTYTREEVEEIVNNSEEVRKADETFRKLYKQLQKSEDNVYDLKYRMEKIQGKIDGTKYKTLMTMIDDEMRWLTDFPKVACEEYQARRRALRRRCWPVLIRNFSF